MSHRKYRALDSHGPSGPTMEALESRLMLDSAPVVVTPLPDYPQFGFAFGEKLTVGVDAFDVDGDPVTISVQTNQPNLIAHVPTGNSFARLTFVQEDGVTPVLGDGTVVLGLLDDQAPLAVDRFKTLAQNEVLGDGTLDPNGTPFYTDVTVHRVITDFMLQTGDGENHNGTGGSALGTFQDETDTGRTFVGAGTVGLANSGPNTNNAQFFIMQGDTGQADNSRWPWLNNFHTIFAQVISGQAVIDTMADTDLYPRDGNDRPEHPPLLDSVEIFESDQLGTITFESINGWVGITDVTVTLSDPGGLQTQYTFTVNVSGADAYEGDDTLDDAQTFYRRITTDGVPQVHSLHSVGASADEDWAYFEVAENSVVTIETNGPAGGDTVLEIVRPSDGAWASDDDGGDGLYSKMEFYLPADTYFVRVYESGGDQTLFGYTLSVKMIPADEPDLVVSDTAPEVIHALPGGAVTVTVTTLNDSGAAAAPTGAGQFDTILFLRTDRNFALADVGDAVAVQPFTYLYAGQFVQHTHTFNAPSQVGTYYLSALADAYDTVWEPVDQYGQEAPNDWGPIISLVVDQPFVDLSIDFTAATTLPAAAVSGDGTPIWTQVLVANRGNVPPDQNQTVDIEIYAREINSQAETLIDTWDDMGVGLLGAGLSGTAQRNVYLPPGLPDGDYELVARLADTGSLQDTDPSNDFDDTTGVIAVTRGFVDLTSTFGAVTLPGAVVEGQLFSGLVPVTVHNTGNVPLPIGQQVDVTIVADPTAGGDPDVQIAVAPGQSVGSLAAGGSKTVWVYVSHAAGLPAGTYDLRADVVPTQALNEEDANNNSATVDGQGQTPQIVSAPAFVDLAADFSPWMQLPAAAVSGDGTAISASVVVTNNGNVMTDPAQTGDVEIYARVAGTQDDTLIATLNDRSLAWIGPGQSRTLSGVVYLPPGLATGQYVLRAEVTDLGALNDPNLADNAVDTAGQIAVTRGFVDITSTFGAVTLPGAVVANQPFSGLVPVTIHNTGNVPLPVGQQVDVTIVGDPTIGAGADVQLAQMPGQWVGGLAGGGSQTLWMWVSVPGGLAAETYDLRADVVPTQALNEEDANNNSATVDGQGQTPQIVSAPAFVDLAADFSPWMQLPAAAVSGDGTAIFASVVVTNNGNVMTDPAHAGSVVIYAQETNTQALTQLVAWEDQSLAWMGPGTSRTFSGPVYLPAGLPDGNYELVAELTDLALSGLNDPNLLDNTAETAGQIAVTEGFVDLAMGITATGLRGGEIGGDTRWAVLGVTNVGNVRAWGGAQVQLRAVPNGGGQAVDLGQPTDVQLWLPANGGMQAAYVPYTLPLDIATGQYDLQAEIVGLTGLTDNNAANDAAVDTGPGGTGYAIQQALLDLAAAFSWIGVPDPAATDTPYVTYVIVHHLGNRTFQSVVDVEVHLSADNQLDGGDERIGLIEDVTGYFAPGGAGYFLVPVEIPQAVAAGDYFLIANVIQNAPANAALDPPANNWSATPGTTAVA